MTAASAEYRTNLWPAMATAAALHVAVILLGLLAWSSNKPLTLGGVTTVSIVDAPPAELRAAAQADTVAEARSEQPSPEVPLEAPVPAPAPTPMPAPAPAKAQAPPKPTPAKPAPSTKPQPKEDSDSFLDRLAGSLPKPTGGRPGKPRPSQNTVATSGAGSANAALADASAVVGERLRKAWIIDCSLEGMSGVTVKVRFSLNRDGTIKGTPRVLNPGSGPAADAAADRALIAVSRAAPFPELPKESYAQWENFTANFLGSQACG